MKKYVTVRVVDRGGNPSSRERVAIFAHQILASGFFPEQNTDSSGEALFEFDIDASADITIYVNGQVSVPRGSVEASYHIIL